MWPGNSMNKKQRVVFLVGIGIIVLMGLIPPWYYHAVYSREQRLMFEIPATDDYGLLFSPPSWDLTRKPIFDPVPRIDFSRLLLQWAVVAIGTAGICFALKR
jgi:hypothetical protein